VDHRLFALERYDRTGDARVPEPLPLLTAAGTRLVAAVHLPADEVVLALVEGPDAETVAAAATAAAWRVDRLSPAVWLSPAGWQGPAASGDGEDACGG
jgi:hypothetical protein